MRVDDTRDHSGRSAEEFDRGLRDARRARKQGSLHALAYLLSEDLARIKSVVGSGSAKESNDE